MPTTVIITQNVEMGLKKNLFRNFSLKGFNNSTQLLIFYPNSNQGMSHIICSNVSNLFSH